MALLTFNELETLDTNDCGLPAIYGVASTSIDPWTLDVNDCGLPFITNKPSASSAAVLSKLMEIDFGLYSQIMGVDKANYSQLFGITL